MAVNYDNGNINYRDQSVYVSVHCVIILASLDYYSCKLHKKSTQVANSFNNL